MNATGHNNQAAEDITREKTESASDKASTIALIQSRVACSETGLEAWLTDDKAIELVRRRGNILGVLNA